MTRSTSTPLGRSWLSLSPVPTWWVARWRVALHSAVDDPPRQEAPPHVDSVAMHPGRGACGLWLRSVLGGLEDHQLRTQAAHGRRPEEVSGPLAGGSPPRTHLLHPMGKRAEPCRGARSECDCIRGGARNRRRIFVPASEHVGVAPADHRQEEDLSGHAAHVRDTAALGRRAARLGAAPKGRQELDHRLRRPARPRDPGKHLRGGLGGALDQAEQDSYPAAHRQGTEPLPLRCRDANPDSLSRDEPPQPGGERRIRFVRYSAALVVTGGLAAFVVAGCGGPGAGSPIRKADAQAAVAAVFERPMVDNVIPGPESTTDPTAGTFTGGIGR